MAAVKRRRRRPHHGIYRAGHSDERVELPPRSALGFIVAFQGSSWATVLEAISSHPEWYAGDWWTNGPDLIVIVDRGVAYKNDLHFLNAPTNGQDWGMVLREDVPGTELMLHYVQETLDRYGGLTY